MRSSGLIRFGYCNMNLPTQWHGRFLESSFQSFWMSIVSAYEKSFCYPTLTRQLRSRAYAEAATFIMTSKPSNRKHQWTVKVACNAQPRRLAWRHGSRPRMFGVKSTCFDFGSVIRDCLQPKMSLQGSSPSGPRCRKDLKQEDGKGEH